MDYPTPEGRPPAPAPSVPVTSHTMPALGDGDYDMTVKIKTPGAGMMVFNRYKLERVLGRGGMGVVWLADDIKLERPVALKFLPSLIGLDPAAVKELKTETRRGLELSHPNIVRIYDFVDDEEAAAISMEYVDGKTLSELRMSTENGVFTAQEISKWLLGVCDALDYAHFQRKVVHRDLKPANIMFAEKGSVAKLADFGIARSLSDTMSRLSAAHTGSSGTLPYMSPQQAMGERPLPTDDVYSLGATIYELLTGKPPFYRGDLPTQIHGKVPPRMAARREELEVKATDAIPEVWETVIAMCLHKDPMMRPANAGQLAELLGLKPSTNTSRTTMPRVSEPQAAAPKKNLLPLALAAAALVTAGGAWFLLSPKEEKAPEVVTKSETAPVPPPPAITADPAVVPAAPAQNADAGETVVARPPTVTRVPEPVVEDAPPPPVPAPPPAAMVVAEQPPAPPVVAPAPVVRESPPEPQMITPENLVGPVIPAQAPMIEPASGFWTVEQMFPTGPYANYSLNGKKNILYQAQSLLKEKGQYTSTLDGKEGKNTHNAILLYQVRNGLTANGFLDVPTLIAMDLAGVADKPDWSGGGGSSGSGVYRKKVAKPAEEPGFFQRATKSVGKLFGGGDKR